MENTSKTKHSSWQDVVGAFRELQNKEERKGITDRLLEEATALPYAVKGILKGSFHCLEQGGVIPQKAYQVLKEGSRFLAYPQESFREEKIKQELQQRALASIIQHPQEFFSQAFQKLQEGCYQKFSHFLRSTFSQKVEIMAEFVPGLALSLITPEGILSYEQFAAKWERKVFKREFCLGFKNKKQFNKFRLLLQTGLQKAGIEDAQCFIRGSAVTGKSFVKQLPFDVRRRSDLDIAISSPSLLKKFTEQRMRLMGKGTRSSPLDLEKSWGRNNLGKAGLSSLAEELSQKIYRNVTFMIYQSEESIAKRGTYLPF